MRDLDENFELAIQMHRAGKIDTEAMQHLMERLQREKQELMMRSSEGAQTRGRRSPSYEDKLCMRMGWHSVTDMPKTVRLSIVNSGQSIFLTVVTMHNDEVVVIKDDPNMFPSDVVVTQLRMLCNA